MKIAQLNEDRGTPFILIPYEVMCDIEDIVAYEKTDEVGWIGEATYNEKENDYTLSNIRLPFQEVNAGTCEITDEGLIDIMDNDKEFDIDKFRYWGHSHVNMSVFASSQDEDQLRTFGKPCDWFVGTVHNKKGEMFGYIVNKKDNLYYTEIPVIVLRAPTYKPKFDWKLELKTKVTKLTYTPKKKKGGVVSKYTGDAYRRDGSNSFANTYPSSNGGITDAEIFAQYGSLEAYYDAVATDTIKDAFADDIVPSRRAARAEADWKFEHEKDHLEIFGVEIMDLLAEHYGDIKEHYLLNHDDVAVEVVSMEPGWETVMFVYKGFMMSTDEINALRDMAQKGTVQVEYNGEMIDITPLNYSRLIDGKEFRIADYYDYADDEDTLDLVEAAEEKVAAAHAAAVKMEEEICGGPLPKGAKTDAKKK